MPSILITESGGPITGGIGRGRVFKRQHQETDHVKMSIGRRGLDFQDWERRLQVTAGSCHLAGPGRELKKVAGAGVPSESAMPLH
jgi:hypothetical protein